MKEKKIKIAYVCREFGPVTGGGIGTYIYNASMAMLARGHKVFLVSSCFHENNMHLLPDGIELISLHPTRENRSGSFISPHHEYTYRVYDTLRFLTTNVQLDVVEFAEYGVEGFATIRAKRLFGEFDDVKLIIKLHTPSSLLYDINEDRRLHVDSLCDYFMEDYCVRHADLVTSPSLSLGEYFKRRVGRNDIVSCPYPMQLPDSEMSRSFTEELIKTVRFIGSVQVRKGIDTFIEAAIQILDKDPEFRFEIWGADRSPHLFGQSYTETCQRLIPDQYKDRIIFSGGVPYSEIPALFSSSCFCVYPSRWENWANVCLEAMSYGCVVLASQKGGMSEMIEHGRSGFVIDPLSPSDITSIILDYYDNTEQLEEISHQAQVRSKEICDPENTAIKIEQNYLNPMQERTWHSELTEPPLVTVVIPFFNQHVYLEETIDSVKKSTYTNIEIIVVNDGSSDPEAIKLFDSLTDVIKVSKENGGLSSARNAGIRKAGGEFILPLDSDDLVNSEYIAKAVGALMNNPELGYVSCHAQNFGVVTNAYVPVGYVAELMPYINTHGKCCNLYRKEVFSDGCGYDENMTSYEDWDFLLTLDENGVEGDVIPGEMFQYRRHFGSMVYTTANRQRADLIQYMMIKHEKALAPHGTKMAIMLARLWKETEIRHEFAEQQIKNAYFEPESNDLLQFAGGTRVQIYSQVSNQWWEHNSVYVDLPEKQWCDIKVNMPFANHEGILRVDPANSPGLVILREIALKEKKTGRTLFQSDSKNDFGGCTVIGRTDHEIIGGALVIRAHDEDPQILLPQQAQQNNLFLEASLYYTSNSDEDAGQIIESYRQVGTPKTILKNIASRLIAPLK